MRSEVWRSDIPPHHATWRVRLACAVAAACCPAAALAQAVDYGALEQVFGEPITTSVTGKPQRASEVPGDLTIITQDDIRRSGADTIPDILQFLPGLDVRTYGFGDAEVSVRGYNAPLNPRLLVLVDGRQVYLDDDGYVAWNALPVQLDEIRQIEVVKGPNSALFGFNAASGVINIITYDPQFDAVHTATIRGGTQAYGEGEGVATLPIGKTAGVRVSLGGWTANGFDQTVGRGTIAVDYPPPRYASFNIDGRWQIMSNVLLTAEGGDTTSHDPRFVAGNVLPVQNQLNFWRVGVAATTRLGTLDLNVYRNEARDNYELQGTNLNDNLVGRLSDLFRIGVSHIFRIGVEYRHNSIMGGDFLGTIGYRNLAVNGMWDWQISPMLDLSNAVRVDSLALHFNGRLLPSPGRTLSAYNHASFTEPSFNSGLVVKISDLDTLRLTASRGLEAPSLTDFGLQGQVGPILLIGNPNLSPTSVWNAEIAFDRAFPGLNTKLTTALFFQRNTDLIAAPQDAPITFGTAGWNLEARNVGSSNEIGVEAELKGVTEGGFRWFAGYSFADIRQNVGAALAAYPNSGTNYVRGTPTHKVVIGAGYSVGKWELDGQARWQSSFNDYGIGSFLGFAPEVVVPAYVTFNARIGYALTRSLTLSGTAEQFNRFRLIETSNGYVERRFIASATFHF